MTQAFKLNKQLANDTHQLFDQEKFLILLHKNATIPWLIIVPKTEVTEVFELSDAMQKSLNQRIKIIAQHLKDKFHTDKINVAAIGNVVSQLHIHVIGRKTEDACWPNVVWGRDYKRVEYIQEQITEIKKRLAELN